MNSTDNEIKNTVKEKYAELVVLNNKSSCCGTDNKIAGYTIMKDEYDKLEGYVKEADSWFGVRITH